MPTDDTITVNRAALVALVNAAKSAARMLVDAECFFTAEDLLETLAPFEDIQE